MDFLPLLRSHLKSDSMLDLLELWDAQVIYEFDRTHENMPDEYWASIHEEGVCFKFDEDQMLECIFLHLSETEGFTPINLSSTDIRAFGSHSEATSYAEKRGQRFSSGRGELLGQVRDWIRFEYGDHSIHYEFRGDRLGLVTLTRV